MSHHFAATCIYCPQWRRCFVGLQFKYQGITNRVLKLHLKYGKNVFVSGICMNNMHTTNSPSLPDLVDNHNVPLYINPEFAAMQGIADNDEINVEVIASQSVATCSSVVAQIMTEEQWLLAHLHGTRLEWILQDHIRVLQAGQTFPVYINASTCLVLKVMSIEPKTAEFVQLTRGSELVLQPPAENKTIDFSSNPTKCSNVIVKSDWVSTIMPWLKCVSDGKQLQATPNDDQNSAEINRKIFSNTNCPIPEAERAPARLDFDDGVIYAEHAAQLVSLFDKSTALRMPPFILICGERMYGKSFLLDHACRKAQVLRGFNIQRVCCRQFAGKKFDTIVAAIEAAFENTCKHDHSIIAFDDLDYICPHSSQTVDEINSFNSKFPGSSHRDGQLNSDDHNATRVVHVLFELQRNIWQHMQKSLSCNIVVIGTARSSGSLHPLLQAGKLRSRHYFDHVFELLTPTAEASTKFVASELEQQLGLKLDSVQNALLLLSDEKTHFQNSLSDFSIGALKLLCRQITHNFALQQSRARRRAEAGESTIVSVIRECIQAAKVESRLKFANDNGKRRRLSWSDADANEAFIERLRDIFELRARYPALVAACPIPLPRGVLLYGIPGSGKTFTCQIIAGAANFRKVFFVKGPELLTKYIGASEARVRQLFLEARQCRPSLIIFDEFDALAPRRGHDSTGVTDRVVNQLLAELDGADDSRGISVLATSSRPDLIDEALLRPGRIDVAMKCELPDEQQREAILAKLIYGATTADDDGTSTKIAFSDVRQVAAQCTAYTAADLRALICEAQLIALRRKSYNDSESRLLASHIQEALKVIKPALAKREMEQFETAFSRFSNQRYGKLRSGVARLPVASDIPLKSREQRTTLA